jgi:Domain of unknown function (DUF6883)
MRPREPRKFSFAMSRRLSAAIPWIVMPILENAPIAIIEPAKFVDYCLDPDHDDGRHKARVFKAFLGFEQTNYADLIAAIRRGILTREAQYVGETAHGFLWRVDLPITGPRGSATVRTGWIYEKDKDVPRLTTAYVLGDR